MVEDRSLGSVIFDIVNHIVLALLGLLCLLPLVHVLAVSLSGRAAAAGGLVTFWPVDFNTVNYAQILQDAQFERSFLISVIRVLAGTSISLIVVVLTAYPLSLDSPGFRGQRPVKWLFLFAMLFSGGLIPWYLVIKTLGMLNTLWALILPNAVQVFYIIVMMNFFRSLPREVAEAATVDGASHWRILFEIYVPLSVPGLATLGLFISVGHWNSWFDGLILMEQNNFPLQSYLQTLLVSGSDTSASAINNPLLTEFMSAQAMHAAMIFVATVPILLVYPFLQRYFVTGLTLGSLKG